MLDIEGLTLAAHEIDKIRHPNTGAVILFARNYESPEQIAELCRELHALRHPPLLIAVDHEGGRVQRFREGFTAVPAMGVLGEIWREHPNQAKRLAREAGYVNAGTVEFISDGQRHWVRTGSR